MSVSDEFAAGASGELLRLVAAGDEKAAAEIFERYAQRLIRLAQSRLATQLAARIDAEDVVMSAYRSFFVAAREGRFELQRGGDLWRLLVELTLHKLYRSSSYHLAHKRSVAREQTAVERESTLTLAGKEPAPLEILSATEELEAVFRALSSRDRQVLELRLQGYEHAEIADRLRCNERTVRRAVNEARRLMVARGGKDFVPSAARQRPRSGLKRSQQSVPLPISDTDAPLQWADYVLHEQIGAGGMGRVYRATRKLDGKEFAIKFLRKAWVHRKSALQRFLAEARTVAALSHRGIVPVHGVGKTPGGSLFLLMDRVLGSDLQRIRDERSISVKQAVCWIAAAAEIVQFAHDNGVIHCDLKPSNLLVDAANQIQVSDFGFAVRLEEANLASLLAGTPAFMAPEQIDSCWGEISPRTDIWGLGSVLYFLLYGRPPHDGGDVPSTLARAVARQPVLFPKKGEVLIPVSVCEILKRCLNKDLDQRFESARSLATALNHASDSLQG